MLNLYDLKCEYFHNPLGIDTGAPRMSWKLEADRTDVMQAAYRIEVAADAAFANLIWDSGCVESGESVFVPYGGPALASRTRYYYRARVRAADGEESPWSETGFFETAFLDPSECLASFISTPVSGDGFDASAPMFRKEFALSKDELPVCARIYATALGLYELRLNGGRVGEYCLTPGWTSYNKRLQYQTYDVTSLLQKGTNALGGMVGAGWYKGHLAGWTDDNKEKYGKRTALMLELHLRYADGTEQVVRTDSAWKTAPGPIGSSELYDGEMYDARLERSGWDRPGADETDWAPVEILPRPAGKLVAQEDCPVVKNETVRPVSLFRTPKGETVLDMGQNMVGWMHFAVKGPAGSRVVLRHAEVLDRDGNFYTENLRSAKETVTYILKGDGVETYEPHFTFQGFRYVRIEEYPGEPKAEDFTGIVLHTGMTRTGSFRCSNEMLNQLQHNILWGQMGNYVDVPTDCPQRDERLGWTGDCQVFVRTACYNMDVNAFFRKWLHDLQADQLDDGGVPHVIPQVLGKDAHSATGWADAAVICPWTVYLCYGDRRVLEDQYGSMKAWIGYMRRHAEKEVLWNSGFHFGDWLALDAKEGSYFGATPNDLTATAFYAYSVSLMAKAAKALGNTQDAREYEELHGRIVAAFRSEFVTPRGRLVAETQTACVLALAFGLLEKKDRPRVAALLDRKIRENDGHLTTGFLGTPYLCHALSENGYVGQAYQLLLRTDYPSWLYPITKGATTIWEHWDGLKPDGSFWSKDMNSFNHYAYGCIGDWMYEVLAGIDADAEHPGYRHFVVAPRTTGKLDWAEAEYESSYGKIRSKWSRKDGGLVFEVTVPPNTTATVVLAGAAETAAKTAGQAPLRREAAKQGDYAVLVGSGEHVFFVPEAAEA